MTVATVVLVPDPAAALTLVDGEVPLRRILRAAWAGGSVPAVLVSPDADGALRAAAEDGLLGDETQPSLMVPGPEIPHGIAWFAAGLVEAATRVTDTRAALLWPFRFAWVDPETVTSLIEAHGAEPEAVVRPAFDGEPGFPALIPAALLDELRAMGARTGPAALADLVEHGVPSVTLDLGDPGTVIDISTPRDRLPAYQGPPEPAAGPPPDWNEAIGARAGDVAAERQRVGGQVSGGRAAPFDQAEQET